MARKTASRIQKRKEMEAAGARSAKGDATKKKAKRARAPSRRKAKAAERKRLFWGLFLGYVPVLLLLASVLSRLGLRDDRVLLTIGLGWMLAWFVALAPYNKPRISVAVMLVGQGTGGDTAAPAAGVVLKAALND